MDDPKTAPPRKAVAAASKRKYRRPELVVYGDLRALTRTGTNQGMADDVLMLGLSKT